MNWTHGDVWIWTEMDNSFIPYRLTVNSRYGSGEGTVLRELEALQRLGWWSETTADPASAAGGR
jgi:hypothetical protein